jgi:hypothetical protein
VKGQTVNEVGDGLFVQLRFPRIPVQWVVEISLDGEAWTEIDRKRNNMDFKAGCGPASFDVSKSAECRFIRLTQRGKRHCRDDYLVINSFEVFGDLLERRG